MSFLLTIFDDFSLYVQWPSTSPGWIGLFVFLGILLFGWWQARGYSKKSGGRFWVIFLVLLIVEAVFTIFFEIQMDPGSALPAPFSIEAPDGFVLMLFSAIPWVLAAGSLGANAATILAGLSGLLIMFGDTHSPFTVMEFAGMGLLMGVMVNQRFRTPFYRAIRHPLIASILVLLFFPLVYVIDSALLAPNAGIPVILDYALSLVPGAVSAVGVSLLLAGLVGEAAYYRLPGFWGKPVELIPSPAEKSIEIRTISVMGPVVVVMVVVLTYVGWSIAGRVAEDLIREQMKSAASISGEGIPLALEAGQSLIQQIAGDEGLGGDEAEAAELLQRHLRAVPYFTELLLYGVDGEFVTGAAGGREIQSLASEEQIALELAAQGIPFQYYAIPPEEGETAARLSFVTGLAGVGLPDRILIGRSSLASNPFTSSVLISLENIGVEGAIGILVDETGRILYHSTPGRVMTFYEGPPVEEEPDFSEEMAADGTRDLVYSRLAVGRDWSIIVRVPALQVQRLALTIAAPLFGLLLLLSITLLVVLRIVMRVITRSLRTLAVDANQIAVNRASLSNKVIVEGVDEVGQMQQAFEGMRVSLKARLDEQEQLLLVSKGVASTLSISEAVGPVLEAALTTGASAARLILNKDSFPDFRSSLPDRFGMGKSAISYASLDARILKLSRQQSRLVLNNPGRLRMIRFEEGETPPTAIVALALRNENLFYGTLWCAYDDRERVSNDDVRFLATVSGQAALAAANAQLFSQEEIGRERLAAILASTPDPVLVTDQQNRLLLANPAAKSILEGGVDPGPGTPIENVISQAEILKLLHSSNDEKISQEITLPDDRVFFATASPVGAENNRVGRVCVLRDITQFKELDALKSEFVSTVSHDLRSPLTLMRGYATMLGMVGELNETQEDYIKKIVTGVENMARLVNNLLDLGRIEAGVGLHVDIIPMMEIVDEVVKSLMPQAEKKEILIEVVTPESKIPLLEVDPALIQQALHNLVENAIKYSDAGGQVTISVKLSEMKDDLVVAVKDDGYGIDPADQPRLFERFYRVANRKSRMQKGTGLGLAIVKSVVEKHHGRVWVESKLEQGSTFFILLPLRQPLAEIEKLKKG